MGLSIGLYVQSFDISRFRQSKDVYEKMLNAMITNNDVTERIRNNKEHTQTKKISNNQTLNTYIINSWLFDGIKK